MKGTLREHPLAELIYEIRTATLSGALHLTHERVKAVIRFDHGEIALAGTNLRAHRFGECLRRWNVLPEDKLAVTLREGISDQELGAMLVRINALSSEELEELRARQATDVICPLLLWTDGEWTYEARARMAQDGRVMVALPPLLIESARRLPPEFVAARFTNDAVKLLPVGEAPAGVDLLPSEGFVLSRLDASINIGDLVLVSGLPLAEAQRAIYALVLGGFVQGDGVQCEIWPRALSTESLAQGEPSGSVSGEQHRGAGTQPTSKDQDGSSDDQQADLDQLFARARSANLYEVLGVNVSASSNEIKLAYYALAKRFHPDRFHRSADVQMRSIESAFAQITQAYERLKDETQRAAYDAKLNKEAPTSAASFPSKHFDSGAAKPSNSDVAKAAADVTHAGATSISTKAEESFRQGLTILKQGNHQQAATHLSAAVQIDPKQPRYRATYGQALAHDARTRRQAEAEFLAAIALDPRNASYRVMLAELYLSIGLQRRAEGELERALAVDPHHATAHRLLNNLRSRSKIGSS
ncbi:MAG: DnaJ domain-containing protein [Pyrinomonadaceae bacterium]|nr:DnaJ domain-containing protein [Pyrinomonadaceae bacterium]